MNASVRLVHITIDCSEPAKLAKFWATVMSTEATDLGPGPSGFGHAAVKAQHEQGPWIYLQGVPEPKNGKNRLHLDLGCADLMETREELEALGASFVRAVREVMGDSLMEWIIMRDPEGNEFCLVPAVDTS